MLAIGSSIRMIRSTSLEITEAFDLSPRVMDRIHRDLTRTNHWLGNIEAIIRRLKRDALPVRKVLDLGCGHGGVLLEIQRRLGVEVVGIDLNPPHTRNANVPILRGDATEDLLPKADVAISVLVAHHLNEDQFISLIRNASRSCRRILVLDLARSPIPLLLFRWFIAPFLSEINAADGCLSIQRAYTPQEFRNIIESALRGTTARYDHRVSLLYIRQLADISFAKTE